ncbi:MAG TPA: hypothetical protein VF063_04025 [Gaiellaceae bacterium]
MGCRAVAAAACVAVASLVAAPAPASPRTGIATCAHGYSYGGYAGRDGSGDVSAMITAPSRPSVATGHAAAWLGVGGVHAGRGNASEWLQTGLAAFPRLGLRLYVEEVSPGQARRFVDLGPAVVGRSYRFRVRETGPDVWRAFVDGRAVGRPAYLPTDAGSWRPVVTAESWAAGSAACNRYAFRFEDLSVRLADAEPIGARVTRTASGFSAR